MTPDRPDDRSVAENLRRTLQNPSYVRAYEDIALLHREELRPIRLQLELLKAELIQKEHGVHSSIVLFGSARILPPDEAAENLAAAERRLEQQPDDAEAEQAVHIARRMVAKGQYYSAARQFAQLVSSRCQHGDRLDYVITTGGGPGIMEAGNRGAWDVGAKSVGMNITLPFEQVPNAYTTPDLCFLFHYFAVRKMHLLLRCRAALFFPGGFGTLDELFETLTLVQTQKMERIPLILFGSPFWKRLLDLDFLVEEGTVSPGDLDLFSYADTPEEAWNTICEFYGEDELKAPADG